MAKLKDILARLDQVRPQEDGKPMSDERISSLATGKPKGQLIRNWRRAVKDGRDVSTRVDTLDALASVLGVSAEWLKEGTGPREASDAELDATILAEIRAFPPDRRQAAMAAAVATLRAIRGADSEEP